MAILNPTQLETATYGTVGWNAIYSSNFQKINDYLRRFNWSIATITYSANINVDWNASDVQILTLTGNATINFSNPRPGGKYVLLIKQDGTGGRTITWGSNIVCDIQPNSTANSITAFFFIYDSTNSKYISVQGASSGGSGGDANTLNGQPGSYYLNRANHTGSQSPTTISPQGVGSGLDSDKLDGFHATNIPTSSSVVASSDRGSFIRDGWNKTSSALTIYVDNINGSDTTGDGSSSNPYATFQKALSELPSKIANNVTIVLKKSSTSYGSIYLSGLVMEAVGSLTIQGEFNQLNSGTVSSFNNSVNDPVYGSLVTVAQITDSTKTWTTNQFQNKLIRVYKNTTAFYRTICYNDATSIYCNQTFPVTIDNTWSYEILDWGTTCDYIHLDNNLGTVNIQNLKVSQPNNFFCSVLRKTSVINVNNCLFESYANGSYPAIFTGETYCTISNSVINANNSSGYAVNTSSGAPFCATTLQGCLVLNNSSSAVLNSYFFSKISLLNGTRLYKGTANPTYGIQMFSGILIGGNTYGKVLIDVGQKGIVLTRGAYIQNRNSFVFGSNVTTKISSYLGLIDGSKLQVDDNFGVNIPNQNHENIHSRILCNGSFATRVDTVSANTTLGIDHHIVLVNASGGAKTITLPNATTCAGRQYIIKKIDSSTNAVTITPQTGQTIDGQASISITTQYAYRKVVSNGINWFLI